MLGCNFQRLTGADLAGLVRAAQAGGGARACPGAAADISGMPDIPALPPGTAGRPAGAA